MGILKPQLKNRWERVLIVIVPCVFLGGLMLVAGSGKLPGQAEFAADLLKSFWTPTIASLISHVLPWVEIVLGALLLLGVFPRIAAVLSLPLLAGFMANNVWAISQGEQFGQCGCLGIWEKILGAMTPFQALGLDIVLLCLALIIILFHPAGFLTFQWWFSKQKGEHSR
jgi:uncharacterized membrane protein YphA (DoxX/SURF4 family)